MKCLFKRRGAYTAACCKAAGRRMNIGNSCGEKGRDGFIHCPTVRRVPRAAAKAEPGAAGRGPGAGADPGGAGGGKDPHRPAGGHGLVHRKAVWHHGTGPLSEQHLLTGTGATAAGGGAGDLLPGGGQGRAPGGERIRLPLHKRRPAAPGAAVPDLCDPLYLRHRAGGGAGASAGRGHSGGGRTVRRAAVDAFVVPDGGGVVFVQPGRGAAEEQPPAGGAAGAN